MIIGEKIKKLRLQNNLTQEELADRCELSKGFISLLERDLTSPSIATLVDILENLGSNLHEFFASEDVKKVVFKKEDQFIKINEEEGYSIEWLVPSSQMNDMDPIMVDLQPQAVLFDENSHAGEEFGYLISGNLEIVLDNKVYKVKKGESFYFESNVNHKIYNSSNNKPAKLLMVSSPPSF
jgi:transcriptional regulator with XRE-family HTH domain